MGLRQTVRSTYLIDHSELDRIWSEFKEWVWTQEDAVEIANKYVDENWLPDLVEMVESRLAAGDKNNVLELVRRMAQVLNARWAVDEDEQRALAVGVEV